MDTMTLFLVSGLAAGCLYALVALGFVLIFQSSGVLNFAHGSFIAVAGFVTWLAAVRLEWLGFLGDRTAWRFIVALIIAAVATALLAVLIDRRLLARMAGAPLFSLVLVTIGLDIVIRSAISTELPAGANAIGSPIRGQTVTIGTVNVATVDLWTIGLTVAIVGVLAWFFRTRSGLAIRSIAIDREAAESVGVPVDALVSATWGLAGVLAAVAAALQLSKPGQGLDAQTAFFALRAFPCAVVGGLTSIPGAVLGGVGVGLVEGYVRFYHPGMLGGNFHLVAPYAVMVAVLLVRPHGLLGRPMEDRA